MSLSEVRSALAAARVRPVKSLGQNFLHDRNLARWIVDQAELNPSDFVVEIGPGLGAITEEILRRGAPVLALEKDGRLVGQLREKFAGQRCEILHLDALDFDERALFAEKNVKVLGNLPYYVASQLLLKFVEYPFSNMLAIFMLQDEMARRISAQSGAADYGALSLRVQSHHQVQYLRKIPPAVFFPLPEVSSALVRITPRAEKDLEMKSWPRFRELLRLGFSQRRKQLRKLLATHSSAWDDLSAAIGCPAQARAEELSREQWIALANTVFDREMASGAASAEELFPVVDEADRQTGVAERSKVHANNLRHRAVHILLFNRAGELLLQKRSATKDRQPLLWDSSAAGHVAAGEEYDACAARELKEELDVQTLLHPLGKLPASEATGQEFIWVYLGEHEGPFRYPPEEISAVRFFPAPVVERWIENKPAEFAPAFLECWQLWRRSTGSPT